MIKCNIIIIYGSTVRVLCLVHILGITLWTWNREGLYLHTGQHKQNKRTHLTMFSGIRTHNPSIREGENRVASVIGNTTRC
jgi:hypothetical protein